LSLSSHLNNDLVAIATDEPDVKLWDPGSNVVGMTLPKAHPGGCSKTAWSKENAFSVITCGFEGRCAVWDARRCATPLFSMDRRRSSSEVEVGRSTSWSSLRKPIEFYDENARAHADGIESVLIHPNGRSVFTKGFGFRNDARVREWDLRTGRCDATKFERFSKSSSSTTTQNARGVDAMNASAGGAAAQYRYSTTMSCTEDGVNIFAPSQDGSILVYDSRTGAISERLKCHADRVTSVQFAARECELFSASMDGFLVRWKSKGARASTRTTNTENRESERDWVSDDEEDDEDIGVGTHRNVRARR
jgi:WD40 repeat protein